MHFVWSLLLSLRGTDTPSWLTCGVGHISVNKFVLVSLLSFGVLALARSPYQSVRAYYWPVWPAVSAIPLKNRACHWPAVLRCRTQQSISPCHWPAVLAISVTWSVPLPCGVGHNSPLARATGPPVSAQEVFRRVRHAADETKHVPVAK